jgi:hypothetical protein
MPGRCSGLARVAAPLLFVQLDNPESDEPRARDAWQSGGLGQAGGCMALGGSRGAAGCPFHRHWLITMVEVVPVLVEL